MGVRVAAATCLQWSQPLVPHPPSSTSSCQTVSASSSSSTISRSRKRRTNGGCDRAIACHFFHRRDHRSPYTAKPLRSRSLDKFPSWNGEQQQQQQTLRRAISATFADNLFGGDDDEEEIVMRLQELALRCQDDANDSDAVFPVSRNQGGGESTGDIGGSSGSDQDSHGIIFSGTSSPSSVPAQIPLPLSMKQQETSDEASAPLPWLGIRPEPANWAEERSEIVHASVERNANSVDLPLSLRILKRKKWWEKGFAEAGESACCSVRKAFSSMLFIIQELQRYTLQMRGALFYEDLHGILDRVQNEIHASFCWLFQQIFSCTPTLMVYVMLLLANFTVYSLGHNAAIAGPPPPPKPPQSYSTVVSVDENYHPKQPRLASRFDAPSIKTYTIGKTAYVGGNGDGGGGKVKPFAGDTDDGSSSSEHQRRTIIPNEISTVPTTTSAGEEVDEEKEAVPVSAEEEGMVWNRMVEAATRMQWAFRDETLMDHETLQRFVSPVTAEVEPDEDYPEYLRTELMYQQAVKQEPDDPLLLSNYAQFLYLVVHDHDRAEYYFKRAVGVEPADAEALSRYANFLWVAKKDLEAAEETYLEAIAADPGNTFHAANYAHFLWNTGGEETCYPLSAPHDDEA